MKRTSENRRTLRRVLPRPMTFERSERRTTPLAASATVRVRVFLRLQPRGVRSGILPVKLDLFGGRHDSDLVRTDIAT